MPQDLQFDPVTRDLILDGKGSFVFTDTAETMVMHQVWCHFGEWWGDPNLGSKLWDLRNFQQSPALQIADEWNRTLNVIVARSRISNVAISVDNPTPGRVVGQASMRDVGTGQTINAFVTPGGK